MQERAPADADQLDLGLRVGLSGRQQRGADATVRGPGRTDVHHEGARPPHLAMYAVAVIGAIALTASPAWAAGAGAAMPWDQPLTRLVNNLTGTTARLLVTAAVVGAGLLWAFTRNEEGLKKLGQIAFGGAIALGAATMMANLGFAGASF
jgi:type IV secretion system protein VirB2